MTAAPAYERDHRALADPARRRRALDRVNYVALGRNPDTYLSMGGELRERAEGFVRNPVFGLQGQESDLYVLHRVQVHGDLHLGPHWRTFAQLSHHRAWSKQGPLAPVDEGGLDWQQFFAEPRWSTDRATLALRVGRQEIVLGSQRLVSQREGPNIRQSFDGLRGLFDAGARRLSVFAVRPVTRGRSDFDDRTDDGESFWGAYGVVSSRSASGIDVYYLGLDRDAGRFAFGTANERRHSVGARLWGVRGSLDYNFEAVYQFGEFGKELIRAWTLASDTGHTWRTRRWSPRLGLRADVASGDEARDDGRLGTFNPLYPRGSYFTENALFGPVNFIDLHPYLAVQPLAALTVTAGVDLLWRESLGDAIYRQPNLPLAGTAGHPARYTGTQPYLLLAWQIDPHASVTVTYVHFAAGEAIRDAGGDDSDYVGSWFSYRF